MVVEFLFVIKKLENSFCVVHLGTEPSVKLQEILHEALKEVLLYRKFHRNLQDILQEVTGNLIGSFLEVYDN